MSERAGFPLTKGSYLESQAANKERKRKKERKKDGSKFTRTCARFVRIDKRAAQEHIPPVQIEAIWSRNPAAIK